MWCSADFPCQASIASVPLHPANPHHGRKRKAAIAAKGWLLSRRVDPLQIILVRVDYFEYLIMAARLSRFAFCAEDPCTEYPLHKERREILYRFGVASLLCRESVSTCVASLLGLRAAALPTH
jgi:hypothetical protein